MKLLQRWRNIIGLSLELDIWLHLLKFVDVFAFCLNASNCFVGRLIKLLKEAIVGSRILIFVETKKGCDHVTKQLRMDGWPALSIHGDKNQAERDWVLAEFKSGRNPIMTATDVAARGLGRITVC